MKKEVVEEILRVLKQDSENIDPEFVDIVNKNFWDLTSTGEESVEDRDSAILKQKYGFNRRISVHERCAGKVENKKVSVD